MAGEPQPLLPAPDEDSTPFWEGCLEGELRIQRCAACARFRHPPRPMCPSCRSLDVEWVPMSGGGKVWSYVVTHPPVLPAYNAFAPYNVIVVELDDDPTLRFVGNLVAEQGAPIDSVDAATIEIGEPVRVVFDRMADDIALPRWVRA